MTVEYPETLELPGCLKVGPMNDEKKSSPELADPIIDLIEDPEGTAILDDFVTHMISLSDVVKNDMRRNLDWDENTVHSKLWAIIQGGLDKNGRYTDRPLEHAGDRTKKYSPAYIESQCLLTEWLNIYRTLRAYFHIARRTEKAKAAG